MKSTIAFFVFLFPVILFAQSKYKPGYILKNNGDTIKGFIKYTEYSWSPLAIEFKVNKDDEAQKFTPIDIKAFEITGFENYISYIGEISTNKNIFPDLPTGPDTGKKKGAIFMKPLVTGRYVDLFSNSESAKNRFFIVEKNGYIIELKYDPYYKDALSVVEHYTYRGQLLLCNEKFNSGNQQLIEKIQDAMFTEGDLGKIVGLINNNGVEKPIEHANGNKRPPFFRLFVGAGLNNISTKTTYGGFNPSIPTGAVQNTNSVTPGVSLGADFFINPNVGQLIFRLEFSYSYTNNTVDHSEEGPNTTIKSYNLKYTARTTAITPQVIYNIYNGSKIKIYVDGGLAINNCFSNDYNPLIANSITEHVYHYAVYCSNYVVQAGVVFYKKIEVSFSVTNSSAFLTTYPDIVNMEKSNASLSVKYLIGGK